MTEDSSTALPIAEVARRLQLHPRTIYRLIERGELRGVKVGRVRRVPVAELERCRTSGFTKILLRKGDNADRHGPCQL